MKPIWKRISGLGAKELEACSPKTVTDYYSILVIDYQSVMLSRRSGRRPKNEDLLTFL